MWFKYIAKHILRSSASAFIVSILLQGIKVSLSIHNESLSCDGISPDKDFYTHYLCEHRRPSTKLLHFIATFNVLSSLFRVFARDYNRVKYSLGPILLAVVVQAYFFAWMGHFGFEGNKPATFMYPFQSLISDFVLFKDLILCKYPMW